MCLEARASSIAAGCRGEAREKSSRPLLAPRASSPRRARRRLRRRSNRTATPPRHFAPRKRMSASRSVSSPDPRAIQLAQLTIRASKMVPILKPFTKPVLSCIDTDFCNWGLISQDFSSSTRLSLHHSRFYKNSGIRVAHFFNFQRNFVTSSYFQFTFSNK